MIPNLYSMASVPPPKDAPDAHDEAKRGTQDVHDSGLTTVSAPASLIGEKVVDEGKSQTTCRHLFRGCPCRQSHSIQASYKESVQMDFVDTVVQHIQVCVDHLGVG
jgi:hypothetical protein